MKKILMVSSECVPFIKTGGLADVVGALPKYFPKKKYDVRVVLPKYLCMKQQYVDKLEYVTNFNMDMYGESKYVGIFKTVHDGITFYFIDNEEQFQGSEPYGGMPWDLGKFTYFCRAVLSMLPVIGFKPDIIHCNDWQTALIPAYLHEWRYPGTIYNNIRTIMTIHNLKFRGLWNIDDMKSITGLNDWYFSYDKFEFYGLGSLLKGGIALADKVTTVSRTYADEICTYEYGEGLDPLLSYRRGDLSGIVNGIDYDVFNPKTDPALTVNYSASAFINAKKKNKTALQKELGLKVDPKIMLIGIVSRLTDQKGMDILSCILNDLMQDEVQIAVLGTGEQRFEDTFRYFASAYSQNVSANIRYSEELAHRIYAGSDAFLMPSLFEPCGLSQLISMRYGTVPIVRKTGGLKDTVIPYFENPEEGTGFAFDMYSSEALLGTIRGVEGMFYDNKKTWNEIVKRAMKKDYSWKAAVKEYMALYDSLI
ncbi:MAG TPA: glycogen synthase GlgA [Candidatus Alectryocaccobium stercorigallinarum]|nr:glycogen synthase GlgA [Candidatus Alectryocaccobium stercorigallinarum]